MLPSGNFRYVSATASQLDLRTYPCFHKPRVRTTRSLNPIQVLRSGNSPARSHRRIISYPTDERHLSLGCRCCKLTSKGRLSREHHIFSTGHFGFSTTRRTSTFDGMRVPYGHIGSSTQERGELSLGGLIWCCQAATLNRPQKYLHLTNDAKRHGPAARDGCLDPKGWRCRKLICGNLRRSDTEPGDLAPSRLPGINSQHQLRLRHGTSLEQYLAGLPSGQYQIQREVTCKRHLAHCLKQQHFYLLTDIN
jgi:hypothetical protein